MQTYSQSYCPLAMSLDDSFSASLFLVYFSCIFSLFQILKSWKTTPISKQKTEPMDWLYLITCDNKRCALSLRCMSILITNQRCFHAWLDLEIKEHVSTEIKRKIRCSVEQETRWSQFKSFLNFFHILSLLLYTLLWFVNKKLKTYNSLVHTIIVSC